MTTTARVTLSGHTGETMGLRYLGTFKGREAESKARHAAEAYYAACPHVWMIVESKGEPNRVIPVRGANPFGGA